MSVRFCSSARSHAAPPMLQSPIWLPADSVVDLTGYFLERRHRSAHRDFRSQLRATCPELRLRWDRCDDARMNRNQWFVRAISFEETTEAGSCFKFVGASGNLPFTLSRRF